jgi:hypothetical protein
MWPRNKSSQEDDKTNNTGLGNVDHEDVKTDMESAHIEKIDASVDNIATSIDNLPVSWFVWLAALTASMAGLLFGYDTGIISGVLVYLGDSLNNRPVTSNEKEMITALCSGGAFVGAIFAGNTADKVCIAHLYLLSLYESYTDSTFISSAAKWQFISAVFFSSPAPSSKAQPTPSPKWPLADSSSDSASVAVQWSCHYTSQKSPQPKPVENSSV